MSVRAALIVALTVAACSGAKDNGEGTLELFQDICPAPGWADPPNSTLSDRWTPEPTTVTAAYASFQAMTDGSARSMVGANWRNILTGEESILNLSVEMIATEPVDSVIWSFDESGLTEADILGWETTGLREVSDIPQDWPACDLAVVTGAVAGAYRHGAEVWTYEGQLTNMGGNFALHFDAGPDHGDVHVRLEFDNLGNLIHVGWMDDAGESFAAGFVDPEGAAG